MKIVFNWLVFLSVVMGVLMLVFFRHHIGVHLPSLPEHGTMTGPQVIIFSLAFAFMWVEVLKWWKRIKPFNCLKCMCGWSAVIMAFTFHVQFWPLYLPLGLFAGAMFEGIKLRWL